MLLDATASASDHLAPPAPSAPPTSLSMAGRLEALFQDKEKRTVLIDGLLAVVLLVSYLVSETGSPSKKTWIPSTLAGTYSYPLLAQTVPSWSLPLIALAFPVAVFVAVKMIQKRSATELTRLIFALCSCVFLTALITNLIKVMVSRPRPNYLTVCFGSSPPAYQGNNTFGGFPICTTSSSAIKEHLKSFPSGHSSFSAAGEGFLTFFLLGVTKCFVGGFTIGRLFASITPCIFALLIGVSRVMDCWHHPSDVVAGLSLGFVIAYIFYRVLYPSFFALNCDVPLNSPGSKQGSDSNQIGQEIDEKQRDSPV